jgi:hypothetical protein
MRAQRLLAHVAAAAYTYAYAPGRRLLTGAAIAQGHNSHSSCYLTSHLEDWISRGCDGAAVPMREQEDGQKDESDGDGR